MPGGRPSIYGLFDEGGRLRYIGKATDPEKRLASHMRDSRRRHTPLYAWIRKHGRPTMRVLMHDCQDWAESERRLIAEARGRGEILLNLADGGDEPFCSPEQRQANAKALNARLRADPQAAKVREYKRRLGTALRAGVLSNAARAKMRAAAQKNPALFGNWASIPDRAEKVARSSNG